jgi:adenine-specific DNA-methyltransferase
VIKYLGSKRRLVPVLGEIAARVDACSALDLFTGTTRVAQEFKRRGLHVTACDNARYAEVFARCYVGTDRDAVDLDELAAAVEHLDALPGRPGYVTETFCVRSRYFQPGNGERIDAMRDELERSYRGSWLYPVLLTALIEAADRVDSTTGVQMAYVKDWAPRSNAPLRLRTPALLAGPGRAVRGDAVQIAPVAGEHDLVYLDPPYNQHRYYTNYHIWETLVAWDAPEHYGIACKRLDSRTEATKSVFNRKRLMPAALRQTIAAVRGRVVVVSYNNEAWVRLDELIDMCSVHGTVAVLAFDSQRYVGARIGIHNPTGEKVGTVSHLRNVEYVLVAGAADDVARAVAGFPPERLVEPASVAALGGAPPG